MVAIWTGCSGGHGSERAPECPDGQAFADVDLAGIWHLEVAYDPTSTSAVALRVDEQAGGWQARLYGVSTTDVNYDAGGLGLRLTLPERGDGQPRTVRLALCGRDGDGAVRGTQELCIGASCYQASVTGRKLERLDEPDASGLVLLSEYGGPANGSWANARTYNVRVHAGLAYLARSGDGLRVVDVSDPRQPVERGHAPVMYAPREYYNDVKVVTGPDDRIYALLASNVRGVVVIDVTDPDTPLEITSFPEPALAPDGAPSVHTLFVEGTRAYLAYTYDASLRIYDVSDPREPRPLGLWAHPDLSSGRGYLHDLYVDQGRAYLNYWSLGMAIVDTVASPASPTLVGEYRDYGQNTSHSSWVTRVADRVIAVHGDEQYGAHVRVVDVDETSATYLRTLGSYQTRPEVSVHNVMAAGDRAYVTYYQDGVRVLDLQDPGAPRKIAHFHTWPGPEGDYGRSFYEGAIGIDVDPGAGLIYVADTHRGLFILMLE